MRDLDIRRALLVDVETLHSGESNTLVVEELGLCRGAARVDIAVVNGSLSGFEIKSERDTLNRLPSQSETYSRVFDFVTVITCANHVRNVRRIVPDWWGIQIADSHGDAIKFRVQRKGKQNKRVEPFALVQVLWRDEALQILEERGLAEGFRSKSRQLIWRRLTEVVDKPQLCDAVRTKLKTRENWRVDAPQMRCGDLLQLSSKS